MRAKRIWTGIIALALLACLLLAGALFLGARSRSAALPKASSPPVTGALTAAPTGTPLQQMQLTIAAPTEGATPTPAQRTVTATPAQTEAPAESEAPDQTEAPAWPGTSAGIELPEIEIPLATPSGPPAVTAPPDTPAPTQGDVLLPEVP